MTEEELMSAHWIFIIQQPHKDYCMYTYYTIIISFPQIFVQAFRELENCKQHAQKTELLILLRVNFRAQKLRNDQQWTNILRYGQ